MNFCYLVRRNAITSDTLREIENTLAQFHHHREIFIQTGVRKDISLPCQHALKHYPRGICLFGSPNSLCSSMTESKHIKAVKEPWRRSGRFNALSQMLRTNSRLDKMSYARMAFTERGMMTGSTSSYTAMILRGEQPAVPVAVPVAADLEDDMGPTTGPKVLSSIQLASTPRRYFFSSRNHLLIFISTERNYPHTLETISAHIQQPSLPELLRRFLYDQVHPNSLVSSDDVALDDCPHFNGRISVFHSAVARFYAPSDLCGAGGMYQERIHSTPIWRGAAPRYDTVFVDIDPELPGMRGMTVGRVFLFFSFTFRDVHYPCALVHWYPTVGTEPDEYTGLWVVKPRYETNRRRSLAVIHLDCIARGAHLIGVYGSSFLPEEFHFTYSLDSFRAYFVNCFADHHTHEFLTGTT